MEWQVVTHSSNLKLGLFEVLEMHFMNRLLIVHWLVFQCDALRLAVGQAGAIAFSACSFRLHIWKARSTAESWFAVEPDR